ncbi:MAG: acyltransferase family protein [Nitrososphaerales archaeon]
MLTQPSVSVSGGSALTRPSVAAPATRLFFFDNLRIVAMILVIAHHAGQAYGPTGGVWPIKEATTAAILDPFFTVNRSLGMSFFFMIAGYLMVISCDHKGPLPFLKDRVLRLGLPVLGWFLLMVAVALLVDHRVTLPAEMAHMWFVQHLLIFCAVYAAWRWIRRDHPLSGSTPSRVPSWWAIVAFALVLAPVSAVIRHWYPIDDWVYLLNFVKVAWADVPRDLSLFIIGAIAYRKGWLGGFSSGAGRLWLAIGVLLAGLMYCVKLIAPSSSFLTNSQSLLYAVWESLLCISLCIGLTVVFRDLWNSQSALGRKMAKGQYATYIFHLGVVVLFQWALLNLVAAPFVKFVLATLLAVPVAFLLGYWLSKPLKL